MRTIGLIGGMSWESTQTYYQLINQQVKHQLGGLHSAKVHLVSVDFAEIAKLQHQDDWQGAAKILAAAAHSLEKSGAEVLLICTNTMHKVANEVVENVALPLLHIADATAEQLLADGIDCVGLLGTRFTMEQDFYKSRLVEGYAMEVLIPNEAQIDQVHNVIYDSLCQGQVKAEDRRAYLAIIDDLVKRGAQAIILGCTEIGLLVAQSDTSIPLYDTTAIHAKSAVAWALSKGTN
ncbi:aspartate/glutamate racemase family protein [Shewanella sp. Scap07]|uniref:aspartate/glutamate racemase family protein n=1 Tax=Shewanella sp. Scap07 TaxID=2589987 RepID=UPI0015C0D402|nr:aspartate/glutamate racemase family protein [Shewanella sp. Scap07]QLE85741.1 aspartate/glutamate racemase family protein [Shewanella sp. Scap07]